MCLAKLREREREGRGERGEGGRGEGEEGPRVGRSEREEGIKAWREKERRKDRQINKLTHKETNKIEIAQTTISGDGRWSPDRARPPQPNR